MNHEDDIFNESDETPLQLGAVSKPMYLTPSDKSTERPTQGEVVTESAPVCISQDQRPKLDAKRTDAPMGSDKFNSENQAAEKSSLFSTEPSTHRGKAEVVKRLSWSELTMAPRIYKKVRLFGVDYEVLEGSGLDSLSENDFRKPANGKKFSHPELPMIWEALKISHKKGFDHLNSTEIPQMFYIDHDLPAVYLPQVRLLTYLIKTEAEGVCGPLTISDFSSSILGYKSLYLYGCGCVPRFLVRVCDDNNKSMLDKLRDNLPADIAVQTIEKFTPPAGYKLIDPNVVLLWAAIISHRNEFASELSSTKRHWWTGQLIRNKPTKAEKIKFRSLDKSGREFEIPRAFFIKEDEDCSSVNNKFINDYLDEANKSGTDSAIKKLEEKIHNLPVYDGICRLTDSQIDRLGTSKGRLKSIFHIEEIAVRYVETCFAERETQRKLDRNLF